MLYLPAFTPITDLKSAVNLTHVAIAMAEAQMNGLVFVYLYTGIYIVLF